MDQCGVCNGNGPDEGYDCAGNCLIDTDNDGICDDFEILGCTNQDALNFDPLATDDDGTCDSDGDNIVDSNDPCPNDPLNDYDNDGYCADEEIYGCTIEEACNYNPEATEYEENSCDFLECIIEGCMDEAACNYDPFANTNSGCDFTSCIGCMDETACNYDSTAELPANCLYPIDLYGTIWVDCDGNCLNDMDSDGSCDEIDFIGCTNPSACNYWSGNIYDDGSCVYADECQECLDFSTSIIDINQDGIPDCEEEIYGCTDPFYEEYNPDATIDDGSCLILSTYGCTDPLACNYNENAVEDDDSCFYPEFAYDCSGICLVDLDGDGVCDEYEIAGCTDILACNYNILATDDDGSCQYSDSDLLLQFNVEYTLFNNWNSDPWVVCDNYQESYIQFFEDGTFYWTNNQVSFEGWWSYCLNEFVFVFDSTINESVYVGEFENEYYASGTYSQIQVQGSGCWEMYISTYFGCTDPQACNYNSESVEDDDSCVFVDDICETCEDGLIVDNDLDNDGICDEDEILGCADMEACNYNLLATEDDGTCEYLVDVLENIECECLAYDCAGECLDDIDQDGVCDEFDNCPFDFNPEQEDFNDDGVGDACDNIGLDEHKFVWSIYPNPFSSFTVVEFTNNSHKLFNLRLYDISGKLISDYQTDLDYIIIKRESLAEGLYFLEISSDNILEKENIIIQY